MKRGSVQHLAKGEYTLALVGLKINEHGAFFCYAISGTGLSDAQLLVPAEGSYVTTFKEPLQNIGNPGAVA